MKKKLLLGQQLAAAVASARSSDSWHKLAAAAALTRIFSMKCLHSSFFVECGYEHISLHLHNYMGYTCLGPKWDADRGKGQSREMRGDKKSD